MKIIVALIFLFSISLTNVSHGQALLILLFGDKLSTEKFQAGINASVSYTSQSNSGDTGYRWDWAFGAFGEINLDNLWSIHFDLTIKTPAGTKNVTPFMDPIPELEDLMQDYSITRRMNYITLPVYLKYKLGKFKIGAGGQVGYMTSATDVYSGTTLFEDDLTLNRDVKEYFNKWDAGVTAMLDYYFDVSEAMRSLRLGLKYYYGLTDIRKDNEGDSVNNSILLISLGIPVGGSGEE